MRQSTVYQAGYVTPLIRDEVSELHYRVGMTDVGRRDAAPSSRFAELIQLTREQRGWTQDELADRAGVSRPTINRYEQAKTRTPDPETARRIFVALKLDPRRIPVLLGYVTEEEMGLPPEPSRTFHATTEDAIAILEDPAVDSRVKAEWVRYLQIRTADDDDARPGRAIG